MSLWTGIIDPQRATEWAGTGVSGGIPTDWPDCVTAACNSLFTQAVNNASITAAINSAPDNSVVRLRAGTFGLTTGIEIRRSNVILRGQGADQTILTFTGGVGCSFSIASLVCFQNGEQNLWGLAATIPHTAAWTGGYAPGTTVVTLSNTTNLQVGKHLILDQLNDGTDGYPAAGDLFVCSSCAWQPDDGYARPNRGQTQLVTVTGMSGNNVTIDPPLKMANWRAGQTPGAWWGDTAPPSKIGVENLTLENTTVRGVGVHMFNALNCWVKGIRVVANYDYVNNVDRGGYRHVKMTNVGRATVRDSYFYGPRNPSNTAVDTYGVTVELGADLLVENNILIESPGALQMNGPDMGSVWAYNYHTGSWVNTVTQHKPSYLQLFEGNSGSGFNPDIIHASSAMTTQFRNFWNGGAQGITGNTIQWIQSYHRFYNVIGNVLGRAANTTYQRDLVQVGNEIFSLGDNNPTTSGGGNPATDARVSATLMRWGNYDTVTAGVRFLGSEVPSGIASFSNPVPATQILPPSFFYAVVPSTWWGTPSGVPAWPPVGPDVTGGNVTGYVGHVWKIPAVLCYESLADDPAYGGSSPPVKIFNAAGCYIGGTPPPPPPPESVGPPVTSGSGLGVRRVGRRQPRWR